MIASVSETASREQPHETGWAESAWAGRTRWRAGAVISLFAVGELRDRACTWQWTADSYWDKQSLERNYEVRPGGHRMIRR